MKEIWKYPVDLGRNCHTVPQGAKILDVQYQEAETQGCMWVLIDPEEPTEWRTFDVVGTGHPLYKDEELEYVGTYQQGAFVWHVFEVTG